MTNLVDKMCTIRQTSTFKLSSQVCAAEFQSLEYYSVSTCTTAVHNFQNPIYTAIFVPFTATCFFVCVHGRYDTINSHLTQIFMRATVNVKTMLLDFFYQRISIYQFTKILLHLPMHFCIQDQ